MGTGTQTQMWTTGVTTIALFVLRTGELKTTHIFFSKNTYELDILITRTVNILTTNELVKLMKLWTNGHRK